VWRAESHTECTDYLSERNFDLVLIQTAGQDSFGFSVMETIAQMAAGLRPKTIFAAACTSPAEVAMIFQSGADDYLKVPFCNEELIARVTSQLTLRRRSMQLEGLVSQRTYELNESNRKLKETHSQLMRAEKHASLSLLTQGITRELKAPVAAIYGGLEQAVKICNTANVALNELDAANEPDGSDNGQQKQLALNNIQKLKQQLCEEITTTHGKIKNLGKILSDLEIVFSDKTQDHHPVDINDCIDTALATIDGELKEHTKVIKKTTDTPNIFGAGEQITRLLSNLLKNSAQATREFGEITIATSYNIETDSVKITIADDGEGIPEENTNKLFDPFFTTRQADGKHGLGLAIVYNIVKIHGGLINVMSETSKGTVISVTLPVSSQSHTQLLDASTSYLALP
jgi:signal transduction histidine kinase